MSHPNRPGAGAPYGQPQGYPAGPQPGGPPYGGAPPGGPPYGGAPGGAPYGSAPGGPPYGSAPGGPPGGAPYGGAPGGAPYGGAPGGPPYGGAPGGPHGGAPGGPPYGGAPPGGAPYGGAPGGPPYGGAPGGPPYGGAPGGPHGGAPGGPPYGGAPPGGAPYGGAPGGPSYGGAPGGAPGYGGAPPGGAPYGGAPPGGAPYGSAPPSGHPYPGGQPGGVPPYGQPPPHPGGPGQYPGGGGGGVINLVKGQNISLTKVAPHLVRARIGLGWDVRQSPGAPFDLDASVFLLANTGRVRSPQDFIFYNNKHSADGSVTHSGDNQTGAGEGDDETVNVDLMRVAPDIQKIVVACTIYDAETRQQNFGLVPRAFIRIVNQDNGQEVVRYDLTAQAGAHSVMIFGELSRAGMEWEFRAVGNGLHGGMRGLGATFGVPFQ